jgi:hypothetical protein
VKSVRELSRSLRWHRCDRLTPDAASLSRETRWSFNLGGGVRIPVATHVRLRLEARGYLTWLGGNANVFCAGGCSIAAKSKALVPALAGVSIQVSETDGVRRSRQRE